LKLDGLLFPGCVLPIRKPVPPIRVPPMEGNNRQAAGQL
jgi:hypothetical protein